MSTRRTVRQALQHVADYPQPVSDDVLDQPVNELVARTLFDIANKPDGNVKGSMTRANRARKMIFDRMGGKRRAGTEPARQTIARLRIRDLTGEADDEQ